MTSSTFVHTLCALCATLLLGCCAVAAQVPDVDTVATKSQRSDVELMRGAAFASASAEQGEPVKYGLVEGRKTLSPLYHLTSSVLYVWESVVAPELASQGGYTDSNADYFKALVGEYGGFRAFFYTFDRLVRNTRVGRHTAPKNEKGLVEDDVKRYARE